MVMPRTTDPMMVTVLVSTARVVTVALIPDRAIAIGALAVVRTVAVGLTSRPLVKVRPALIAAVAVSSLRLSVVPATLIIDGLRGNAERTRDPGGAYSCRNNLSHLVISWHPAVERPGMN